MSTDKQGPKTYLESQILAKLCETSMRAWEAEHRALMYAREAQYARAHYEYKRAKEYYSRCVELTPAIPMEHNLWARGVDRCHQQLLELHDKYERWDE